MSTQITNIAGLRANLASFLDQVKDSGMPVVVVKHGDPVVAMISINDLDAFQKWKDQIGLKNSVTQDQRIASFDALSREIESDWNSVNIKHSTTQEEIETFNY